jgi:hypothetical protein
LHPGRSIHMPTASRPFVAWAEDTVRADVTATRVAARMYLTDIGLASLWFHLIVG